MKTNDLYKLLPTEIQYDIDMQLYDEFNDEFCRMEEWLDELYSIKDIADLKRLETRRKRELVIEAILKIVEESKLGITK